MFTGLVREIGNIRNISSRGGILRLVVEGKQTSGLLAVGDSVAVNGICLTTVAVTGRAFTVEAAAETKRLTTLASWRCGRRVHLEPALRMGDALDGHLVQGHVDGVGSVKAVTKAKGGHHIKIAYPRSLGRFLTPKGSVAVDGVSLTVDEHPDQGSFVVNVIPHTMERTNFSGLRPGAMVNLEMDVLVKAALQGGWHPSAPTSQTPAAAGVTLEGILASGFARKKSRGSS